MTHFALHGAARPVLAARAALQYGIGMSLLVANGATMVCSMGTTPARLIVLRRNFKAQVNGLANVMDFLALTNIPPFGACVSPINPAAHAPGGPPACLPLTTGPWVPGCNHVNQILEGTSAPVASLTADSICQCAWQGQIVIADPNTTITTS